MANRTTILLDGIDLSTKDVTVLDYSGLTFAGYKDTGFKNPEGIDGVLDSPSTALSGLTGSLTVLFKGESEKVVNDKYRKFKQFIRSKSFWRISTKEDPEFYRLGKFLGESEPGTLTDVPVFAEASFVTKISIQYKDGYEYSRSQIEKPYAYTQFAKGMKFPNPGRPTRQLVVELKTSSNLTGFFRIGLTDSPLFVEAGTNGVYLEAGTTLILNLGTFELIKRLPNNQVRNMFNSIKRGGFFKLPNGESSIYIQYRANESQAWTNQIPVTATITLTPSYY